MDNTPPTKPLLGLFSTTRLCTNLAQLSQLKSADQAKGHEPNTKSSPVGAPAMDDELLNHEMSFNTNSSPNQIPKTQKLLSLIHHINQKEVEATPIVRARLLPPRRPLQQH